jgi:predicted site-specific integrase-resolvase
LTLSLVSYETVCKPVALFKFIPALRSLRLITHEDRLLRFGAELVFAICEAKKVEVVILNQGEDASFEEDLAKDVLEIITVFSARLYGARSRKNAKLLAGVEQAVNEAENA